MLLFLALFAQPALAADPAPSRPDEWVLPAIVTEGAPSDILKQDAVLPALEGRTRLDTGSGSIEHGIGSQLPLPVDETGRPGSRAQFRGLGRSVEDTEVQVFGVPLNSPQGTGFDLSIFPQYLWAGYRFQAGPPLGALDPRAVSGTLTLLPWTRQAMMTPTSKLRLTQFYSSAGVMQASAAGQLSDQVAAVVGYSDGDARGPSGVISGRWGAGRISGRYHFLGTRIDAATPGSRSFPTPNARQLTARVIPVLETDATLASDMVLKSSIFYDGTFIRYDDPDSVFIRETADQIRQGGIENALLWQDWKFGLSGRQVTFRKLDFEAPAESVVSAQASRALDWQSMLVEPTVQAVGVSRYGVYPAGTLGVRKELAEPSEKPWGKSEAVFTRLSYSRRFPTLADRYYDIPGAVAGNPALGAERDWTWVLGFEARTSAWRASLQGYAQLREDAQIAVTSPAGISSKVNAGTANVYALMHQLSGSVLPWLELSHGLTLTSSHVSSTGFSFPYLPGITDVLTAEAHPASWDPAWGADLALRFASSATVTTDTDRLSGYGLLDAGARVRVHRSGEGERTQAIHAVARVENVFDRPVEFVKDFPTPGRVISLSLIGEF